MVFSLVFIHNRLLIAPTYILQAMHAQTSVAAGMKSASKAMSAMNKVSRHEKKKKKKKKTSYICENFCD